MQDVYIIDGSRTPFIKVTGKPNVQSAADLAVAAAQPLLARQPFAASKVEQVIAGCVAPNSDEANIGRIIALRLGCGHATTGWTVQRNCASGLQAIDCAFKDIKLGRHDLVLAGGTEAMSRAPLQLNEEMVMWLADFKLAKSASAKAKQFLKLRFKYLLPVISLLRGLTDPIVNMSMGETAEKLAAKFGISRQDMDQFALQSHQRAMQAINNKYLNEISPLFDWHGKALALDNGVRADSSIEKLATLKPAFDKPYGSVTAGNSSQISDGSAFVLLASKQAIDTYNLQPLGKIKDIAWSALDPSIMGLGPAHAISKILQQQKMKLTDINFWEINEAFAAQVLACIRALDDIKYCQEVLGLDQACGAIDQAKLNVDGGAIAVGHPVGASGTRLVLHLLHILRRTQTKYGVASLCIGGGQGGAILLEN